MSFRLPNLTGWMAIIVQILTLFLGDDFIAQLGGAEAVQGAFQIVVVVLVQLWAVLTNTFFRKSA